jgi:chromosome segregation ATPase
MELEQVIKRMEWLDEERRKDKDVISALEERLLQYEGRVSATEQQIKDLDGEITRLGTVTGRMDVFDESLAQHRVELKRLIDNQVKQLENKDAEITELLRAEIRGVDTGLVTVRKGLEPIADLSQGLQARVEEENRLNGMIDELKRETSELKRSEEEQSRVYRLIEDGRRQDTKRLTDLQGEVTTIRKKSDEQQGRLDVVDSGLRKVENRLNELVTVERERRDAQAAFLEKQALQEVERERTWKEWQVRFDTVEKQATDVENQLQALDTTQRSIQRTREMVDELMDRVERRINEIVEMQRLAEGRFRQEWVTFKADDQKRWTNYTLSQEEQRSETGRRFDRTTERLTFLEDGLEEIQDIIQQIGELTEKRLQSVLSLAHEWVSAYERTRGGGR